MGFPKGNPNVHAIDDVSASYFTGSGGEAGFRFQFWFHRPVDTQGMVIRFRDQVLTPNGELKAYRGGFAQPVKKAEAKKATLERVQVTDNTPGRGRVPPALKQEMVPEAPDGNVEWLPGYWHFHAELDDFVWTGGTFVVRAVPKAEAQPEGIESELDGEVAAQKSANEPEPIEPRVPPRPSPRAEKIPKPPSVKGAMWISGYWELRANAWHWVGGRWQVPKRGARFRAPSIEVKGGVKVYLPGGWSFGTR